MKDSRYLSVLHVSCNSCEVKTLDDHNFLISIPLCAFLDSMERYLSLDLTICMWMAICSHIDSEKLIISLSALITRILNEKDCYVSLLNN